RIAADRHPQSAGRSRLIERAERERRPPARADADHHVVFAYLSVARGILAEYAIVLVGTRFHRMGLHDIRVDAERGPALGGVQPGDESARPAPEVVQPPAAAPAQGDLFDRPSDHVEPR